ncbi:MAG TPA: FAD-dependent oxidoreductase [Candidatus Binatia bacterium]|nr:FAD-dependent oxidoreductase [Candidatus Binatia bacterium]
MPIAPNDLRWHDHVDVGIIGAGGCGLTAALAAAHPELRVVVWEKAKAAGGNTNLTDGAIPAAGTAYQRDAGLTDTAQDFARDVLAHNHERSDPALTHRLCEASAPLIEWLTERHGLALELERYILRAGHRQYRMHAVVTRTGQALVEHLLGRASKQASVTVRLATPVLHLWQDESGTVIGAQIKSPKKSATNVRCAAVILANDGFGGNAELVAQRCPAIAGAPYAGSATDRGDALLWGQELGAACEHLDAFHAHPIVAVGSNYVLPSALLSLGAIIVNQRGERFANESDDLARVALRVRAQPGQLAYLLFDARMLKQAQQHDPRFEKEIVPRTLRRGADLADLSKQFQLDAAAVENTVAAVNAALGHGADAFGRTLSNEPMQAPFYAARVTGALLATQGGLRIDTGARVLRADGVAIKNLYAGGGAAVGLSGPGGEGYLPGMGLLCALAWGKIAGEEAAYAVLAARAAAAAETTATTIEPSPSA